MNEIVRIRLSRILASLIDGLFMFIILAMVMVFPFIDLINEIVKNTISQEAIVFLIISFFAGMLLDILYLFLTFLLFKNATLGMRISKLSLIQYDGKNPRKLSLLNRSIMLIISFIVSFGLIIVVNLITLLCNESGKNFFDVFAGNKMVSSYDA